MKNNSNKELLSLLVRVYNHAIHSYYYFPEVIIYGSHKLDREEFEILLKEEFIEAHQSDSFGKIYHLSKKAEAFVQQYNHHKKRKIVVAHQPPELQGSFQFA